MSKKNWKKIALGVTSTLIAAVLVACGGDSDTEGGSGGDSADGEGTVYYLNFKPEIADQIEELAKIYTDETGVEVKMTTAAGGTYEQTLRAEITKSAPPTIFFINGPIGYNNWKDYTMDLSDTSLGDWLLDPGLAITGDDDGLYGVPVTVEGYGIIYNNAIMEDYFASDSKSTSYTSVDDINNFDVLKEVVEDMQSIKDELGIDGVFSSTSLASGEQWRWQTHLANYPVYYEFNDKNVDTLADLEFTYGENFKNIFDLYVNNSTTEPGLLGAKTTTDSMTELALGQSAMVQNGNWGWGQIAETEGNVVNEEDIRFLPIYTGVDGEEENGLAIGTENFLAVNSQASEADIQASLDFIEWMYSSEKGKDFVINEFGFIPTFNTFEEDELPGDPLAKSVIASMNNDVTSSVPWMFTVFPSEQFKNDFGDQLLLYAQGQADWEQVEETVVDSWARESEMAE